MKNSTDISVILDRSGSMQAIKAATIESFNNFVREQRKINKPCKLSVYQFDDQYETIYADINIHMAPELNDELYQPRGWTALLDAIGRTIIDTGNRLAKLPENQRPNQVMMIIITDGMENKSKEFTQEAVANLIKHQRDKYSWEFLFIGANQDSILTAKLYNINPSNALNFSTTDKEVKTSGRLLSAAVSKYRSAGAAQADLFNGLTNVALTEEDRKKLEASSVA